MERILLLMSAQCYAEAEAALHEARREAASPGTLSYALVLAEEPSPEDEARMAGLGSVLFLAPACDALRAAERLWQGERNILLITPAARFPSGWDRQLNQTLRGCVRLAGHGAALTGYLPRDIDPVDAVSPVAPAGFDPEGRLVFHRGTPLRYVKHPARAAFLHRDFIFAPAGFFREVVAQGEPYFLSAFRLRWNLYTPETPVLRLQWDLPLEACSLPEDGEDLNRFGEHYGIDFAARSVSPAAQAGRFGGHNETYVPVQVRVQEHVRSLVSRSLYNPLCVTCCLDLPGSLSDRESALIRFRRLASMRSLSLLCYTEGAHVRQLTLSHPNVLEYKARYGLPTSLPVTRERAAAYVALSKVFLLQHSREKFLSHSHYIWMDFDYLRYPVYDRATLDWETVCTDRITLAMVDGAPDTSMIVVPADRMLQLCRELIARCDEAVARTGSWPEETGLWAGMVHDYPDWFDAMPLPGLRELFSLTMVGKEEEWGKRQR